MRNIFQIIYLLSLPFTCISQDESWVSYHHCLDAKQYVGKKFKLTAYVRTEMIDTMASAHIWARVDKEAGGLGFFDNMMDRPIKSSQWSKYIIASTIDDNSTNLCFGVMTLYSGNFYFDNLRLEIETSNNNWKLIYHEDFETGIMLKKGTGSNSGQSSLFHESRWNTNTANGKSCLKISGNNIPNYGGNALVGKYAKVNGINLYYEIYGSGQPLIILHGNAGSIANASEHIPALMKKYNVIAIDSRAQGKSSDDISKPLTYDQMASDVNQLLDQLGIDSTYIYGHSDGAILGILLAKDYPKKVKKVLAFAPNMQADSNALFPWLLNWIDHEIDKSKSITTKRLSEMLRDYPNVPYESLTKIEAPILIMGGDRDAIKPEHFIKLFQHIPKSQLCILPGSTHLAVWHKREIFMTLLFDFFDNPFTMPSTKDVFGG